MKKTFHMHSVLISLAAHTGFTAGEGAEGKQSDRFDTGAGELMIVYLGHASLVFLYQGTSIYIDPVRQYADFSKMPKADIIVITHEHFDHLDPDAINTLKKTGTKIILPPAARKKLGQGEVLSHGTALDIGPLSIEAVPAYNTTPGHLDFHPKSRKDNGYVLTIGTLRVYIAGDTEDIPEMALLGRIDVAFLPMNQPYTMIAEQVATAAKVIKPRILYPYHYDSTDCQKLVQLLSMEKNIEVRIRNLQ